MKLTKRLLALFLILATWLTLTGCEATVDVNITEDSTTTTTTAVVTDSGDTTTTTTAESTTVAEDTTATEGTSSTVDNTTSTTVTTTTSVTVTTTTTTTTTKPTTTATTVSAADKALVDQAFRLGVGAQMQNVTLTGVVTDSQGYSAGYNNATFDLQVEGTDGAKTIYCYRVKPADANRTEVAAGDRLQLSGTIQNYKGTIEFYPATYTHLGGGGTTAATTTRPTGSGSAAIDEDGIYDSKEEVALYIHIYGKLPKNYFPKSEFNKNNKYQCCGGDRFMNREGRLPSGEIYYECDIDTYGITSRGAKRLVWTTSGIVYYTGDHYETFTQLYGER